MMDAHEQSFVMTGPYVSDLGIRGWRNPKLVLRACTFCYAYVSFQQMRWDQLCVGERHVGSVQSLAVSKRSSQRRCPNACCPKHPGSESSWPRVGWVNAAPGMAAFSLSLGQPTHSGTWAFSAVPQLIPP